MLIDLVVGAIKGASTALRLVDADLVATHCPGPVMVCQDTHMERDGLVFLVGTATKVATRLADVTLADAGLRERRDFQEWIKAEPEIVGRGLLLVATEYGGWASADDRVRDRLDLLFLDSGGSLVLCELKRDEAWDTTDMQALKYAAFCNTLTVDDVVQMYGETHAVPEEEARAAIDRHVEGIEVNGLGPIRVRLVAGGFPASVTSTVLFLREYGLDLGCVLVGARRASERELVLTSRQIIPLPQAEEYMIRVQKREQVEREKQRLRTPNAVPVLLDAGAIPAGTILEFRPDQLSSKLRAIVEPWLNENPAARRAEWTGVSAWKALRWSYDGSERSASALAVRVVEEAGGPGDISLPGPSCWATPDGKSLFELSLEVGATEG